MKECGPLWANVGVVRCGVGRCVDGGETRQRSRCIPPPLPRARYVGWMLEQDRMIWSRRTRGAGDGGTCPWRLAETVLSKIKRQEGNWRQEGGREGGEWKGSLGQDEGLCGKWCI